MIENHVGRNQSSVQPSPPRFGWKHQSHQEHYSSQKQTKIHNKIASNDCHANPFETRPRSPSSVVSFIDYSNHPMNNAENIPPGLLDEEVLTHHAKQVHHDSPDFPVLPPDCFGTNTYLDDSNGGRGKKNACEHIQDIDQCRIRFLAELKQHRNSKSNTFKQNCRHYLPRTAHKIIEGRHFTPEMAQPIKIGTGRNSYYKTTKCRLAIQCVDENNIVIGTTHVEFAHTPLFSSSNGIKRNLGEALHNHATDINPKQNECRTSRTLVGAMGCGGVRPHGGEFIKYKQTSDALGPLQEKFRTYCNKHGFGKWINQLHERMLNKMGNEAHDPDMGDNHWAPFAVTTSNYGNEDHKDMSDACQGITIWHEHEPHNPNNKKPNPNIKNWHFIFPNLIVEYQGKIYKGFAIPLQHGTIVTWDARFVRHCAAVPTMLKPKAQVHGAHFGITNKQQNLAIKKKEEKLAKKKRPISGEGLPVTKRVATKSEFI